MNATEIIADVLPDLFAAWGGPDRAKAPYETDIELTRLALLCDHSEILSATAVHALRGFERADAYRDAAETASRTLDCLDRAGRAADANLLRAAAEIFTVTGDTAGLARAFAQAATLIDDPSLPSAERRSRAQFRGRYAAWLTRQGNPDQALTELNAAQATFETLGDRSSRAVTLGDIARIKTDKGEVDAALALHEERLAVYEALGDRRERAVTLGDIARIKRNKGEVDAALALHEEEMQTYEALGDRRSRAVTLGAIARIMTNKGEVDAALALHEEEMQTYEALGDRRSRAVTLGDIANIKASKGEVDAALALQSERLEVNRGLGDLNGIAAASFDIGQIQLSRAMQQQDMAAFQAAYDGLAESYAIFDRIGRLDGICGVGMVLAQVLALAGQKEEARTMVARSLDGYRRLGWAAQVTQAEELMQRLA